VNRLIGIAFLLVGCGGAPNDIQDMAEMPTVRLPTAPMVDAGGSEMAMAANDAQPGFPDVAMADVVVGSSPGDDASEVEDANPTARGGNVCPTDPPVQCVVGFGLGVGINFLVAVTTTTSVSCDTLTPACPTGDPCHVILPPGSPVGSSDAVCP
jgi:hypothetical protein